MPTRLAWVGTAHIHTPGFINEALKRDLECAGVWDHDVNRASANADKLGGIVKAVPEMVEDAEVDGFVVCSETVRHLDLVRRLAPAGKPIFVEKPMGFDRNQSLAMLAIFAEHKVTFQTGYFSRGRGAYRELKRRVDAGSFGTVTRVRGTQCHSGALGGWFDNEWRWMADRSEAGVGAYGDLATHSLDLMMWMFGPVTSVTATLAAGTARYEGCEEFGEAILRFENGTIGTLAASWDDVADPIRFQICGTKGHATLGEDLLIAGADGKFEKAEGLQDAPAGFPAFLDFLEGKEVELVTPHEAAQRDAVMDAIYRAAESRTWVDVN
jgi:predicted dehydrogenase